MPFAVSDIKAPRSVKLNSLATKSTLLNFILHEHFNLSDIQSYRQSYNNTCVLYFMTIANLFKTVLFCLTCKNILYIHLSTNSILFVQVYFCYVINFICPTRDHNHDSHSALYFGWAHYDKFWRYTWIGFGSNKSYQSENWRRNLKFFRLYFTSDWATKLKSKFQIIFCYSHFIFIFRTNTPDSMRISTDWIGSNSHVHDPPTSLIDFELSSSLFVLFLADKIVVL